MTYINSLLLLLLLLLLLCWHSFAQSNNNSDGMKSTYCLDPVTVVYVLADGIDPKVFAQTSNIEYLHKLGKGQKNIHEFKIACADGYPGGHSALAIAIKTHPEYSIKRSVDIMENFGVQHKRVLHPRTISTKKNDWIMQLWHLTGDNSNANAYISQTWSRYGIQGDGIIVSIVDDGLAWDNIDLHGRFSMEHSANYNSGGGNDPYPKHRRDGHGTAAAGIAAASGSNGPPTENIPGCAFGVAPMAQLAGIRLISEAVTDATESEALSHHSDVVSVYSCSWGPYDNGEFVDGPGPLSRMAIEESAKYGRGGKGCVYVWAAGNGASRYDDSCAYDGYASMPEVMAIGALARDGSLADYSEDCAALFAVAPSSGHGSAITTTDVPYTSKISSPTCRHDFGGTSAAAPFVTGVAALVLQSNPSLTSRDVQRVIATSATKIKIDDPSWTTNAAGIAHSNKYGFGLINADKAITLAQNTETLVDTSYDTNELHVMMPMIISNSVTVEINVNESFIIERAVATVSVIIRSRSNLTFALISPSGTTSYVRARKYDTHGQNLDNWPFTFLTMWGETVRGIWKFRVFSTIEGGVLNKLHLNFIGHI